MEGAEGGERPSLVSNGLSEAAGRSAGEGTSRRTPGKKREREKDVAQANLMGTDRFLNDGSYAPILESSAVPKVYEAEGALPCSLVPIFLDLVLDSTRLIDHFSWNRHERHMTPEKFAAGLVDDLNVSPKFIPRIAEEIRRQVAAAEKEIEYAASVGSGIGGLHPIRLNLRVKDTILIDQFEWDLSNPSRDPERFASGMCRDLGLSTEWEAAIAAAIREQELWYLKARRLGVKNVSRLPPVKPENVFRDLKQARRWSPHLHYLNRGELVAAERELIVPGAASHAPKGSPGPSASPLGGSYSPAASRTASPKKKKYPAAFKPVNSFLLFSSDVRPQVLALNPNTNVKEISRIVSERWKAAGEEERSRYQALAMAENKKRLHEVQSQAESQGS